MNRQINELAPIHHTIRGAIDLSRILGLNAYSANRHSHMDTLLVPVDGEDHIHDSNCAHDHGVSDSSHTRSLSSISTLSVALPPLSAAQQKLLDSLLRSLLWEGCLPASGDNPSGKCAKLEILRTKGIFQDGENGNTYVIQGVREIYELKAINRVEEEVDGRLVLIGRGLQAEMKDGIATYIRGKP
jgi:G3E family GTPase